MSTVALQHLGSVFISPLFSFFNQKLTSTISNEEPVYFLAREGYWLSRAYSEYCKKINRNDTSDYLLVSRAFLFKIGLLHPDTLAYSLNFKFKGSLYELLKLRFMLSDNSIKKVLTEEEQQAVVSLPEGLTVVSTFLKDKENKLAPVIMPSFKAYREYLKSKGFFKHNKVNLVDIGFSGTIQTLLTIIFDIDTTGHYLIASKPGVKKISNKTVTMLGHLKEGVKLGEGYVPLDRSMFLESLLTAPVGQFQDIRVSPLPNKIFDMYYGRKVASQQNFHLLEQICNSAILQMCIFLEENVTFSRAEIEEIYNNFVTRKGMLPRCSWPLFSIDDDISNEGTINALDFFGLKL